MCNWVLHTSALWFELSHIPQLGTGQRWPCALAVLWGPTLHPLPTEPPGSAQGWARGSGSSEVSSGRCWKPRCCSKREGGLHRVRGSAEPKETGSARGCPCARGARQGVADSPR